MESIAPMRSVTKVLIGEVQRREVVDRFFQFLGKPLNTGSLLPLLPCLQELLMRCMGWGALGPPQPATGEVLWAFVGYHGTAFVEDRRVARSFFLEW